MPYQAAIYKVMIAFPSDAVNERQIARNVIHKWNGLHSEDKKIVLLPIAWDTHTAPEMGNHPQRIIDKRILERCDLLVGIFLHRLGTPTLDAQSGTAHEIDSHTISGKPAMVYFLKENIKPTEFNKDQYDKLVAFKKDMQTKGLLHECDRKNFENSFLDHLIITINNNEYFQTNKIESLPANLGDYDSIDEIKISDEAKELLTEASKDKSGYVLKISHSDGVIIKTNSKNMVPSQEARIVAKWEYALNELIENNLVEEKGYEGTSFKITHRGYEYVDKLKKEVDRKNASSVDSVASLQKDDLDFDTNTGTYISKKDYTSRYCGKCLDSSPPTRVPLTVKDNGWRCNVCDKFYPNPNYTRPTRTKNDYEPFR